MMLSEESLKRDREWRERQSQLQQEWQERNHQWQAAQAERDRQWRTEDLARLKISARTKALIALAAAVVGAAVSAVLTFLLTCRAG